MAKRDKVIILRPQAQRDLDAIAKTSSRMVEAIIEKIELLTLFPKMGPAMDGAYEGFRQLLCGKYRIVYEIISSERIEVAYIRHGARQLGLRLVH